MLAAVLALSLLGPAAPAEKAQAPLIGSPPRPGAKLPAAAAERVDGDDPYNEEGYPVWTDEDLLVVVDSPYEIWSGMGSWVHVAVYDKRFAPAAGVDVFLDDKPVGVTDR